MKMKWGVLGSTGIAYRRTIPEGILVARNAELAGVYSPTAKRNRRVADEFGVQAFTDEDELISSDCDILYVASPNDKHCPQVIKAAEAGKHVFCEKPLGLSVQEAERMVESCTANGVKLGVGFMMRFHSCHREALSLIRKGRLGQMILGRAQLSCWYPPIAGAWRQDPSRGGGGTLPDLASHCIDLLEMFFGPVRSLFCSVGNLVQDYASEDTAVVMLEFENGTKGVVDTLFNVPDAASKNRLELYGSRGSIRVEGTIGQGDAGDLVAYVEESEGGYDAEQGRTDQNDIVISPAPANTYRAEVEAFSQAVLEDTDPPVDGTQGLWNQKLIAACYQSARTGERVTLHCGER